MADLVNVKGLSQLQAFLDSLPAKVEKNIMRGAMRAGAKVLREEVKAGAAVLSGQMRDGIKVVTNSRRGRVTAGVRARGPHGYLATFHEYGTKTGLAARPFFRPALDLRGQDAVVAAGEYVKQRLATKQGLDTSEVIIEGEEE